MEQTSRCSRYESCRDIKNLLDMEPVATLARAWVCRLGRSNLRFDPWGTNRRFVLRFRTSAHTVRQTEQKKFVRRRAAGPAAKKGEGVGFHAERVFHTLVEAAPRSQA